ncbi:hypothetical protein Tco_0840396 [Tanacetum coccineum]|uniref:Uncharacterized protein n=1 Tax=Tanacetum coccineum TaxID=301880 RepID=A0ABQ5AY84_9ASTR
MGNVKKSLAERTRHKRQYDRRMNERQMQSRESKVVLSKALDASLVVTECVYKLTAQHNVLANEQQHTEQSEPIYDTYLLEKVDSNTTPDSTNMCHRGGEIDQDAEQYKVKSPLLKAELVRSKEMIEKETYNELSRRFLLLEKHCISLEISIQQKEESFQSNKPCKNQDAPEFCEFFEINDLKAQLQAKTTLICNLKNQIKSVKEASNEAKVKNDIDVIETINIELEHSVAKLLAANEQLHKENEHLKQTYKELYDSIKKTLVQNKDIREIDQDAEQYKVKSPLLKAELVRSKEMIEKEMYNELLRMFLLLEKQCISLEISIQQKEESFQSNKPCKNQDVPEFCEFFEINDLKAQLQAKTTLICNLKNQIKSMKEASNEAKVKHDIDVIETINIELEHSVAKLLVANEQLHKANEHLKQTYKELYDSIKKTRIQNKDISDSLISQINQKSVENADLKAQIQEKGFKSDALNDDAVHISSASLFNDKRGCTWHLQSILQAPLLKEKKGVRRPGPQLLTPRTISSGLVPQPPSPTPNVPPTKNDWDSLFCPMFDEYFNPSPSVVQHVLVAVVQEPVVSTGTPSSTRIDQDTPSTSTSQTTQEEQSHVIPTSVEEDDHGIESNRDNDLLRFAMNVLDSCLSFLLNNDNMANENVPSSFTATTETTSTLPPPPPPPQQSTVHRDICEDGNPDRANIKQDPGLHKDGEAMLFKGCEYAGPRVTTSHEGNVKAEKTRLLSDFINQRKRYFAQQRSEERRNKPITQAQRRTYMSNYIKHMRSHTLQQLKRLSIDELKALFETTMRRVQTFHPIESEGNKTVLELTTESSKRDAEVELDHEGFKKQKTNEASGSVQEQPEEEETKLP